MHIDTLGKVIAERSFLINSPNMPDKEIRLKIGMPRRFPDSSDYFVPFVILGLGSERIRYAAGVDAVQALQLVMPMIRTILEVANEKLDGNMFWAGDSDGTFGF